MQHEGIAIETIVMLRQINGRGAEIIGEVDRIKVRLATKWMNRCKAMAFARYGWLLCLTVMTALFYLGRTHPSIGDWAVVLIVQMCLNELHTSWLNDPPSFMAGD